MPANETFALNIPRNVRGRLLHVVVSNYFTDAAAMPYGALRTTNHPTNPIYRCTSALHPHPAAVFALNAIKIPAIV